MGADQRCYFVPDVFVGFVFQVRYPEEFPEAFELKSLDFLLRVGMEGPGFTTV